MNFSAYSEIWRFPAVRQAVFLGVLGKAPWFGVMVVLTLHVVGDLGQGYAGAGALTAVFTVAVALASPLRGRLLDTLGLRRTLAPSLVLLPLGFIAAPFLGYWALMAVMAAVGLLAIPWFVLTRQLMLAAVPHHLRRPALALDSVVTEIAFMGGPTLGILLATTWSTGGTLTTLALASVSAAAILTLVGALTAQQAHKTGLAAITALLAVGCHLWQGQGIKPDRAQGQAPLPCILPARCRKPDPDCRLQ